MRTQLVATRPVRMAFGAVKLPTDAEFIRHGHKSVPLMNCATELSRLSRHGKIKLFVRARSRNGKFSSYSLQIYFHRGRSKEIYRLNDMVGKILYNNYGITKITIKKNAEANNIYNFFSQVITKGRLNSEVLATQGIKLLFEGEEPIYPATEAIRSFDPLRV